MEAELIPSKEPRAQLQRAEYEMAPAFIEAIDPFDAEAIRAAGDNPRHLVEQYLVLSTNRFAVVVDGHIAALCGTLVRIRDQAKAELGVRTQAAQFWVLASTHLNRAPISARKLLRHVATELLKYYDGLYGYIDARHDRMLRLAQWLGGELAPPAPFGDRGALFQKYTIRS